jgi:hypothetical protein
VGQSGGGADLVAEVGKGEGTDRSAHPHLEDAAVVVDDQPKGVRGDTGPPIRAGVTAPDEAPGDAPLG